MKNILSLAILTGVFAACNPTTQTSSTTEDSTATAVAPAVTMKGPQCFEQQNAADTFLMQLRVTDAGVEGDLKYGFKEKDKNTGQFAGVMYGDTLLADYHFMSEGKTSVRQVAFLITDSTATEGYGDMEDKDGKMVFKNSESLTFGKGIVMKKTECKN
jgi:hypothetical protein